jgi:hypothetical protein
MALRGLQLQGLRLPRGAAALGFWGGARRAHLSLARQGLQHNDPRGLAPPNQRVG